MATEFPEGEHQDGPDGQHARDPLDIDPDAVPLLPPHVRGTLPSEDVAEPQTHLPGPGERSAPAPGLEFAPPAPGLVEDPVELTAPGPVEDAPAAPAPVEQSPSPVEPTPSNELPPWAVEGSPPAASLDASETERAAWPTVDPVPLEAPQEPAGQEPARAQPPEEAPLELPTSDPAGEPETTLEAPVEPTVEPVPVEPVALTVEPVPVQTSAPDSPDFAAPADLAAPEDTPRLEAQPAPIARPPEEAASAQEMYDVPLGTLVYRSGLLSAEQIESALAESERIGKRLGEVLVDTEMIDERDLGRLLAGQKGLPFIDLAQMNIDAAATELLPAASARIYCALPIAIENGTPVVAVSDPTNGLVVEGIRRAMGGELSFTVATRSELQRAIASHHGGDASAANAEPPTPAADPARTADAGAVAEYQLPGVEETSAPPAPDVQLTAQADAPNTETDGPPDVVSIDLPEEPVLMHEPEVAPPTPIVSPEASVSPLQAPTPIEAPGDLAAADLGVGIGTVRVKVRLSDGELVDAGAFADVDAAMLHGRHLIQSMSAGDSGEWPFLAGRFLRPAMVVSIDLVEERQRY